VHSQTQNTRGLPPVNKDAGVMQDLYSYDQNGNITAIADQQENISGRAMGYDGLDRLTTANADMMFGRIAYSYDPLDNLRTSGVGGASTHSYDSSNKLNMITKSGVVTGIVYDARGNITGRGTQGFYFDLGNRMQLANGKASYTYDGLGRRVNIFGTDGVTRMQFYDQAGQLMYGTWQQGMTTKATRYVYLGGKLIAETVNAAPGTTYAHTDALGSPVAITSSTGALVRRTRYEPNGGALGEVGLHRGVHIESDI
jgi:uncharacterized protein RhaS with RHS repeats